MEQLPDNAAHILVVDDDQRIRDLLARYLFENGFRVSTATDAETARASADPSLRAKNSSICVSCAKTASRSGAFTSSNARRTAESPR